MSVTCPMAAASVVTHRKDNSPEVLHSVKAKLSVLMYSRY